MNVCNYIQNISPNEENIVVTHDAVRPFITQKNHKRKYRNV